MHGLQDALDSEPEMCIPMNKHLNVGGQEQENGNWPLSELHVTSLKCLAVGLLQNRL